MYLEKSQQKLVSGLCASFATLLMLGAGYLAIANPQRATTKDLQAALEAGQQGVNFDGIAPQNGSVATAMLLFTMGAGLGVTSWFLSDGTPNSLVPAVVVDAAKPESPNLSDDEDVEAWDELAENVATLCREVPWLKQMMKAESIVIIGDSGSGKSSIAQAVVILRSILFGWSCDIYDPDADNNLSKNTWIHGDLIGVRKRADTLMSQKDFAAQVAAALPESMATRNDGEGHSIIFDEITGWGEYDVPVNVINGIYSSAIREIRRKNIHPIFILHGSEKGLAGGEDIKSGLVKKLLQKSFVITAMPEAGEYGETLFRGKATINGKGETYISDNQYKKISIPPQLAPMRLVADLLGEAFDEFGFGIRGFESDGDRKEHEAFQRELAEMWMDKDKAIERLRNCFDTPIMRSAMARAADEPIKDKAGFDIDAHPEGDFIAELSAYLLSSKTATKADDEGFYGVRDMWRRKVMDSNRFASMEAFKDFLKAISAAGAGRYRETLPEGWMPFLPQKDD